MSESKGVEVTQSPSVKKQHPDANNLQVKDGHLILTQGKDDIKAIYAPGHWHSAKVAS